MQDKNQNNVEETTYTSPKDVEPVVIGELRKEKIGRPMIVIELGILFIIVLIGLPIVTSMMNDENSVLYKFLNGNSSNDVNITTNKTYLDGTKAQSLLRTTTLKSGNIVLKDFSLYNNTIKMTISSYNNVINLDEKEYYFEVLSSKNNNKIAYIKLTGTYDYQEKEVEFKTSANFNSNITYLGKIVLMNEDDYPEYALTTDESGIGSVTCKNDSRKIEYVFANDKLIEIKDNEVISSANLSTEKYLSTLESYRLKASKLGSIASVEETSDGILYKADIDLEKTSLPEDINDYNYYDASTNVKRVTYSMIGKGFDCE